MKTKKYTYESHAIVVSWDKERCTHVAECVRGLPAVFQRDRRPWIDPSLGTADDIAEVIHRCPTGALSYTRLDGGEAEVQTRNEVRVLANGPVVARGDIIVIDEDGEVLVEDTRVALCRCGGSSNKPFCDGTHRVKKFDEPAVLGQGGMKEASEKLDGRLWIYLRPNGAIRFVGPLSIQGADPDDVREGTRVSVCRCGRSGNAPFCDGAHKLRDA